MRFPILATALAFCVTLSAAAQQTVGDPELTRTIINTERKVIVANAMQLDEQQSLAICISQTVRQRRLGGFSKAERLLAVGCPEVGQVR